MNRTLRLTISTLATLALASASTAGAQDRGGDTDFKWEGRIAPGNWLEVHDINGSIRVEAGTGDRTEVTAVKRWRRGEPEAVRIEVVKFGGDKGHVRICAMWLESARCDEEGYHSGRGNNRNDTQVDFTIRLARGVKVDLGTVNGSVRVNGATAEVEASTVNGSVDVSTSVGPVNAETVNGNVTARMTSLEGNADLEYATVNGSITLILPAKLDADVDLSTVNGHFETDFPVQAKGRIDRHHLRGSIGAGGRRIRAKTVNGSVELQKGG
jgi:hypothetical protein